MIQTSRLLLAGVFMAGGLVIGLASRGSAAPDPRVPRVLEAQEFRLRDAKGATRAELLCDDGATTFHINYPGNKARLELVASKEGNFITISDAKGQTQLALMAQDDGSSSVMLMDAGTKKAKAMMSVGPDGKVKTLP